MSEDETKVTPPPGEDPDRPDESGSYEATRAYDPTETPVARMDLESGLPTQIGQYRILGQLGEGGMGVVYEAEQQSPKRRVALKVVRGGHFVDESLVKLFQREVETLGRLKHPNIGAIYESGRTGDGQHFFAMELVSGGTLDDYLAEREKRITPEELEHRLRLFRQLADAVHYAHQRGVIHRDIKPGNIVVTEAVADDESGSSSGNHPAVKVLDFGLARITEGDTAAASMVSAVGMIKGTLAYMSPEQARGDPAEIDLRTDVYALGVVLYQMLTGERPYDFEQTSIVDAVRVICETPPRPLRQAWHGVRKLDGDLETIVAKALEKDPDQRYGSAAAFSEDIERFLTSQPILARPPSTVYQIKKLVARNKLGATFAATLLVLLIGFGVWMNVLWQRSEVERARAEASVVLTLGRFEIDRNPSGALAHALASLEISDSAAARRFALEALWRGPPARVISSEPGQLPAFSPDGHYLAIPGADFAESKSRLVLFSSEGGEPLELDRTRPSPTSLVAFDAESKRLFSARSGQPVSVWSVPEGELLEHREVEEGTMFLRNNDGRSLVSLTPVADDRSLVQSWSMDGGDPTVLGHIEGQPFHDGHVLHASQDPVDSTIAHVVDAEVYVRELASLGSVVAPVGRQDGWHPSAFLNPRRKIVGSALKETGEVRLWNVDDRSRGLIRSLKYKSLSETSPAFDPSGRYLAAGDKEGTMWFWDLQAPPDAEPIVLRRTGQQQLLGLAFHPQSPWLVTGDNASATLWPLDRYALELRGHAAPITSLAFDPEGRWLASLTGLNGEMRMWPLEGTDSVSVSVVDAGGRSLAVAPDGAHLLIAADGTDHGVSLLNADASDGRLLGGRENWEATFSPDGRFAAATGGQWQPEVAVVTVWDLDTGETIVLDVGDGQFVVDAVFLSPQRLVSSGLSGLRLWDLASRSFETLSEIPGAYLAATADGKTLLRIVGPGAQAAQGGEVWVYDLASGETRALTSHGDGVVDVAVHPDGKMVVTGGVDGTVRVGPLSGEEPHLLLGHEGLVQAVGIDPKGRWIAAGGVDGVIRLWPVPEGRPFHTLPREELLARLRSATNYRVVADEGSPDGYRLEIGPFPGWESLPTW